jgi:hypothetical protein
VTSDDLLVLATDELIERSWRSSMEKMVPVNSGSPALDKLMTDMEKHIFRAGWMACLLAMVQIAERREGS